MISRNSCYLLFLILTRRDLYFPCSYTRRNKWTNKFHILTHFPLGCILTVCLFCSMLHLKVMPNTHNSNTLLHQAPLFKMYKHIKCITYKTMNILPWNNSKKIIKSPRQSFILDERICKWNYSIQTFLYLIIKVL